MRRVVDQEGGCIVWGGNVRLSPADDLLIRVERPLDFDSEGQLVASVLSKKLAAGATHVVIDMPVGPTAKVRSAEAARGLCARFEAVADALAIAVKVHVSDGLQPVGRGIGPALEALDVLAVLRGEPEAPQDLCERALALAAEILEFGDKAPAGFGLRMARRILESGDAWRKFATICQAQGGFREPPCARLRHIFTAAMAGECVAIDNRRISRVAKLAGAPRAPAAGVEVHIRLGQRVERGAPLYTVHAEHRGELEYALSYAARQPDILRLEQR
jgi:thymidine phosphorylase